MANTTLVQHAPWGGDGGAEETAYGLQCLDYFLRAPNGSEWAPDAVMFNWGLHNHANVTILGQEGNMSVYTAQLDAINARLVAWAQQMQNTQAAHTVNPNHYPATAAGPQLLLAITKPMICKLRVDED
eukprot:7891848-Ditylum_brightwellii.AAC.1